MCLSVNLDSDFHLFLLLLLSLSELKSKSEGGVSEPNSSVGEITDDLSDLSLGSSRVSG